MTNVTVTEADVLLLTGLTATATIRGVDLKWDDATPGDDYNSASIYRSDTNVLSASVKIGTAKQATQYMDNTVNANQTYYYWIRAVDDFNAENGAYEPAGPTGVSVTTSQVGTADLANLAITSAKIGNAQVKNANIENAAITSAKIGNLQVKFANIENLTVGTTKIVDNAVTDGKFAQDIVKQTLTATYQLVVNTTNYTATSDDNFFLIQGYISPPTAGFSLLSVPADLVVEAKFVLRNITDSNDDLALTERVYEFKVAAATPSLGDINTLHSFSPVIGHIPTAGKTYRVEVWLRYRVISGSFSNFNIESEVENILLTTFKK